MILKIQLTIILLMFGWFTQAHEEDMSEDRIKAAYIYNFITFTGWPSNINEKLNLCVLNNDPFVEILEELNGEKAGTRHINVIKKETGNMHDCQIFFMSHKAMLNSTRTLIKQFENQPVLTVTDMPGALDKGFIIGLEKQDNRVVFVVNHAAARHHLLTLSSKLLRMSSKVLHDE